MTLDELYAEDTRLEGEIARLRRKQAEVRKEIERLEAEADKRRRAARQ
jgi:hypothetical protein